MEIYPNGSYNTNWWSSDQCQNAEVSEITQGMNDPENQKVEQETKAVYNSY